MHDSRPLAVLVFGAAGSLIRRNSLATELTGFKMGQPHTLSNWCENLFRDPGSLRMAKRAIEKATQQDNYGYQEFKMAFQTVDGSFKVGQFTVVSTGILGPHGPQTLISILEEPATLVHMPEATEVDVSDDVDQNLTRIKTASMDLLAMVEARQRQVRSTSLDIGDNSAEVFQLWDDVFQEVLALVEIRKLIGTIMGSTLTVKRCLKANFRIGHPERPPSDVPLGVPIALPLGLSLREVERFWVLTTLHALQGNRSLCALRLGVALRTVRNKIDEYRVEGFKIPPPAKPGGRRKHLWRLKPASACITPIGQRYM